jgi:cell division septation protein DedD
MSNLDEAIQLIRMGHRDEGRQILEEMLETDESNEEVWLWLSAVVDNDEDRGICLENVLAINPDNAIAQRGLDALKAGRYNPSELLGDLLEEEEEAAPTTFIDDFAMGGQFDEDDELVMPGSMKTGATATGRSAGKKKQKSGGLNIRLIILLILGLFVILVLGGVATFSLLSGGDEEGTPGDNPPVQETPAEGQAPPPEATPTETPTPAPTDTPTATPTSSLQLPTPRPTDLPTPTATTVVSPTPPR